MSEEYPVRALGHVPSPLRVGPIATVDGTPVVDIKSVLKGGAEG